MKSLLRYLASVFGVLLLLELLVASQAATFSSLHSRLHTKLAMLRDHPVDIAYVGSSQTLDGFDHPSFIDVLANGYGLNATVFNAGITALNRVRAQYMLERIAADASAQFLIIELSKPISRGGPLGFSLDDDDLDSQQQPLTSATFAGLVQTEPYLQAWMANHSALVANRDILSPKLAEHWFYLQFGQYFDVNNWMRSGVLLQLFAWERFPIEPQHRRDYAPLIYATEGSAPQSATETNAIRNSKHYKRTQPIVATADAIGLPHVFAVAPVDETIRDDLCTEESRASYALLAREFSTPIFDYSCRGLPQQFMRDNTHLNPLGRKLYSELLAHDLVEIVQQSLGTR